MTTQEILSILSDAGVLGMMVLIVVAFYRGAVHTHAEMERKDKEHAETITRIEASNAETIRRIEAGNAALVTELRKQIEEWRQIAEDQRATMRDAVTVAARG